MKLIQLDPRGIAHYIVPLIIIIVIALGGTFALVASHADSPSPSSASTYFLFAGGANGEKYSYAAISSSASFAGARCGSKSIARGKTLIKKLPTNGNALGLICVTPNAGQSYSVSFHKAKPTAQEHASASRVQASNTANSCLFIHSNDSPTPGVTKTYPRNSDGSCNKAGDPNPESAKKPTKKHVKIVKKKPSLRTASGLALPPNFSSSQKNSLGYFLLPASPDNKDYYVHTPTMPGHESTGASPDANRYGSREIAGVFYSVALKYHDKYPDSKLVIGDVNAPGHASHKNGVDMDVYTSDRSAGLISSRGGSTSRSIELGKMFMDTGKVKFIFFNSPEVQSQVNAYANSKGLPGNMQTSNATHEFHFHVRLNTTPGPTQSF